MVCTTQVQKRMGEIHLVCEAIRNSVLFCVAPLHVDSDAVLPAISLICISALCGTYYGEVPGIGLSRYV